MKYRIIISIFILSFLSQCDSVTGPKSGPQQAYSDSRQHPLDKPTLLQPKNDATQQQLTLNLTWQKVDGASAYEIQISATSAFSETIVNQQTDTTSFQIGNLSPKSTYYWKVRALTKDSVKGGWSKVWDFTTTADTDQQPVTASPKAPADGSVNTALNGSLEWSAVAGAKEYHLQIATNPDFSSVIKDTLTASASYQTVNINYAKTYYWHVRPQIDSTQTTWSDAWKFTTKSASTSNNGNASTSSDMWVSAYLASYNHYVEPTGNWGNLPTDGIDWDSFTHLFYFSLNAKADGTLSTIAAYQNMSPDRINAIVSAAHKHNKPVIITIGGWGNHDGFSQAISSVNRTVFITNLVALIKTWGFDGIDLDMEPIQSADVANYKAFVKALRTALDKVATPLGNKPLLTAATAWQPGVFAELQNSFDQINLMTYDYSGAWQGWVSWHNSALQSGGLNFPNNTKPLPSIEGTVKQFTSAGVPKSKLGIGIDFYGYVWSGGSGTSTGGITAPDQSWTTAPTVKDNVSYHEIMSKYNSSATSHWDSKAKAAYLSIDNTGSANDKFISYDNEQTIKEKINYIRQHQLGGTIIWELSGGYRKNQPAGSRDKLLQTVKHAVWQ